VSLSSSEAEYQALSECVQESVHPEFGRRANRKEETRHHIRGQPRDNFLSQESARIIQNQAH
jgi:hypothetical protein